MDDDIEKALDRLIASRIEKLRKAKYSYDDLLIVAANSWVLADIRGGIPIETKIALPLSDVCKKIIPVVVSKAVAATKSNSGKHAVDQREDQILKPGWIDHCTKAKNGGTDINRLSDLLDIKGYDLKITKVSTRKLKDWAKEAGITLKPGRPPGK